MRRAVGVDGCRFGWVAVSGADDGSLGYGVFRSMRALLDNFRLAESIFVDIPIGLPWRGCVSRPCDEMARRLLKHRHVCVFTPPCRAAVRAKSKEAARLANVEELGRSLSEQALGICAKVAEVDELLATDEAARTRLREVHPEVCFWALNRGTPLADAKTSSAGVQSRLNVLSVQEPRSEQLLRRVMLERPRSHVKADDVLDALVAYVTASAAPAALTSLRGVPLRDEVGLPMEMLYLSPR
jgi:predicted RNase H-like nuclease